MNNFELADLLICSPITGKRELEVVVKLNQTNVGPSAASVVNGAFHGIDWDDDRIVLTTDEQLVSWDYLEHYIPDIREQIQKVRHERDVQAWREMHERKVPLQERR